MKNEEKNEIQSRREFFKNAAKAALPILGAVVLSKLPVMANSSEESSTYCSSCNSSCTNGCRNGCSRGCGNNCSVGCQGNTHKYHPSGDCATCKYYCAGCSGKCSGTCSGSCVGSSYTVM